MPISIDIGSRHIKVVTGAVRKDAVLVASTTNIKIPQEITMGAPSTQIAAITNLLRPLFVKDKRARSREKNKKDEKNQPCNLTLSDDRFLIRNVTIPKGSPQEMKSMALNELVATFSVDPNSIVETVTLGTHDDGRLSVRAGAADRDLTQSYYKMIEDIKLVPKSLSFHSNALAKLLKPQPSINNNSIAGSNFILLDCGMFACTCHVFSGGAHQQSRYLPLGFSDLYHHLARRSPMGDQQDKTIVYTPTFVQTSSDYKNMPSVVTNQIEAFLRRLAEEMGKFIRMSVNTASAGNIERIYLYGGNAKIEGFDHRLSSLLNIKVDVLNNINNVEFKPGCEGIVYHLNAAAALLNA